MPTPKIDPDGLTVLERAFVDEMLKDPSNQTDALRRAGSKATNMRAAACEMAKRPKVKAALEQARAERAKRTEITVDRVLYELWKRGTSNLLDYGELQSDGTFLVNLSQLTQEQGAAIQEISFEQIGTETKNGDEVVPVRKVKIKLADNIRALELVGKHLGMFTDRVKHEFPEDMIGVVMLPARRSEGGE